MAKSKNETQSGPNTSSGESVASAALNCMRRIYGCGNLAAAEKLKSLPDDVVTKIGELELNGQRSKVLKVIADAAVQIAEAKTSQSSS
jgi:hypothetical protein